MSINALRAPRSDVVILAEVIATSVISKHYDRDLSMINDIPKV